MQETPECLCRIFKEVRSKCYECDYLDSCLIEAVLIEVQEETEYPSFKKRLEEAINRADIIWKDRRIKPEIQEILSSVVKGSGFIPSFLTAILLPFLGRDFYHFFLNP